MQISFYILLSTKKILLKKLHVNIKHMVCYSHPFICKLYGKIISNSLTIEIIILSIEFINISFIIKRLNEQFFNVYFVHVCIHLGPKFIAPDLCDDENGERKYSVQSFLLSPEEMTLLKPMHMWTKAYPSSNGDQTMDMNMLNQLSEAGIIVGSHIQMSDESVEVLLQKAINEQILRKFVDNLGINDVPSSFVVLENIFGNVRNLINLIQENPEKFIAKNNVHLINGIKNHCEMTNGTTDDTNVVKTIDRMLIKIIAKTVVDCAYFAPNEYTETLNDNALNPLLYEIISESFIKNFKHFNENTDLFNISFDEIEKLLTSSETMLQIKENIKTFAMKCLQTNKVDMIKAMINRKNDHIDQTMNILEQLQQFIKNETIDELFETVQNLICHEPSLMSQIISEMKKQMENIENETVMVGILRKCIVTAVQSSTNDDIKEISQTPGSHSTEILNKYLMDTISLARALGFTDCILNLSDIINSNDGDIIAQLKNDEKSFELLQRVIVMHKLSKNNVQRKKSMNLLRHDPYSARSDIILRELIRCSGICTINLIEGNLVDSNDVPLSLIYSGNQLAIEDFLIRKQSKPHGPILIVKDRFQAVVPREASRNVLTGKCAYTVLDENGIRYFEPLHMFTALKLKNVTMFEDRFSSYSSEEKSKDNNNIENNCDIDKILNMGAMTIASNNGFIAYKSTNDDFYRRRHSPSNGLFFVKSHVNYRPSFYL